MEFCSSSWEDIEISTFSSMEARSLRSPGGAKKAQGKHAMISSGLAVGTTLDVATLSDCPFAGPAAWTGNRHPADAAVARWRRRASARSQASRGPTFDRQRDTLEDVASNRGRHATRLSRGKSLLTRSSIERVQPSSTNRRSTRNSISRPARSGFSTTVGAGTSALISRIGAKPERKRTPMLPRLCIHGRPFYNG